MALDERVMDDFEPILCDSCNRGDTGTMYSDGEGHFICQECFYELPSRSLVDFNTALENSVNWERVGTSNGRIVLRCVHCGERHDDDWPDEDDERDYATDFLNEDKAHDCKEDETDG